MFPTTVVVRGHNDIYINITHKNQPKVSWVQAEQVNKLQLLTGTDIYLMTMLTVIFNSFQKLLLGKKYKIIIIHLYNS